MRQVARIDGSIRLNLAVVSGIPGKTSAGETVVSVDAESLVEAGKGFALVNLNGAVFSCESFPASAGEIVDSVDASSSIDAGIVLAVVVVLLAVLSYKPVRTHTREVISDPETSPSVFTDISLAVNAESFMGFAVFPHEPYRTAACVQLLSSIVAGRAVLARPMVGAVVEILIAKQASPSVLTFAGERPRT